MECPICEHRQRKFICQSCVRTHLRELRAQISKAGGERQVEVEKAAKLLGSGVERERWARAETQAFGDRIAAVKVELVARRESNKKARQRAEEIRRSLSERRENLRQARELLPATASASTSTASPPATTSTHLKENSIPFASTQAPATPPRRFSRLFPFPASTAPVPPSPPARRHKPPDPLVEARHALEAMGDALAETRSVLVRELAEAFELQAEMRQGVGGEEYIWTLGRMTLPAPDELNRSKPPALHATLYNTLHFMRLTAFYLGVKLPFEVTWGASSNLAPPFHDLFIPGGQGEGTGRLESISEDGETSGPTPVGAGTPWIVAGRGLGGSVDGGWGKYTTPLALNLPAASQDAASSAQRSPNSLQSPPASRPLRNQPRSTSSPSFHSQSNPNSPSTPTKRRPSLLSLARVSAAAKYVATSAYGSTPQATPTTPHARTMHSDLPTRASTSSSQSSAPKPRQRSGSVSIHQANPPVRVRVASLAAIPSRVESPLPGDNRDGEPQVQTPIQVFVAALTMVQYNAAYLAWTQGALNVGDVEGIGGTLELLGATVTSEGIGFASHVTSAAQEHALPPPTRSFTLSFPSLLARNISQIGGGGLMSAGLPSHDGDGEWDLIEASEEEDGVG
ncbi:hypothetical protein BDV93DRAFT_612363 [Ceratobasidium sp. AG-I]|nr:hypothetical protein BDV93DRAFT_612363 [Ceratobasidium sp. AG-I]